MAAFRGTDGENCAGIRRGIIYNGKCVGPDEPDNPVVGRVPFRPSVGVNHPPSRGVLRHSGDIGGSCVLKTCHMAEQQLIIVCTL